jgi:hypothetical protein
MPLNIGENYHIELQPRWGKSYDVKIDGMASPSAIEEISPATDLKKDFFDDYGIPISTYLLLLNKSTTVYICVPVTSFDPYTISENESEKIFIPETLIDQVRTYQYILAKRYNFLVYTGIKRYKNVLVEDQFFNDIKSKIIKRLKTIEDFVADNITAEATGVDVIVTNDYLNDMDTLRQSLVDSYKAFNLQKQNNFEDEHRNLYEQIANATVAEKKYEERRLQLANQLIEVSNQYAENTHINSILSSAKEIMREMMDKLKSGQLLPDDIPTFDELYEKVEKELYG